MQGFILKLTTSIILILAASGANASENYEWRDVSGTGIHYFSTAIQHSERPTQKGVVQRSTDTVDLEGDLIGRVLYHPITRINLEEGVLINRGHQVFSGTVLGQGPVLIHDDEFRFDVNLATGETIGKVRLTDRLAGPIARCLLTLTGDGTRTEAGDSIVSYTGRCKVLVDFNPEADRW